MRYEIYKENPLRKIGEKNKICNALHVAIKNGYCLVKDTEKNKWYRPLEAI